MAKDMHILSTEERVRRMLEEIAPVVQENQRYLYELGSRIIDTSSIVGDITTPQIESISPDKFTPQSDILSSLASYVSTEGRYGYLEQTWDMIKASVQWLLNPQGTPYSMAEIGKKRYIEDTKMLSSGVITASDPYKRQKLASFLNRVMDEMDIVWNNNAFIRGLYTGFNAMETISSGIFNAKTRAIRIAHLDAFAKTGDINAVRIYYGNEDITDLLKGEYGLPIIQDLVNLYHFKTKTGDILEAFAYAAGNTIATMPLLVTAGAAGAAVTAVTAGVGAPGFISALASGATAMNIFGLEETVNADNVASAIAHNTFIGAIAGGTSTLLTRAANKFMLNNYEQFLVKHPYITQFGVHVPTQFATGTTIGLVQGQPLSEAMLTGVYMVTMNLFDPQSWLGLTQAGNFRYHTDGRNYYSVDRANNRISLIDLEKARKGEKSDIVVIDFENADALNKYLSDNHIVTLARKAHNDYVKITEGFAPIRAIKFKKQALERIRELMGDDYIQQNERQVKILANQLGLMALFNDVAGNYNKRYGTAKLPDFNEAVIDLFVKYGVSANERGKLNSTILSVPVIEKILADPDIYNIIADDLAKSIGDNNARQFIADVYKVREGIEYIPTLDDLIAGDIRPEITENGDLLLKYAMADNYILKDVKIVRSQGIAIRSNEYNELSNKVIKLQEDAKSLMADIEKIKNDNEIPDNIKESSISDLESSLNNINRIIDETRSYLAEMEANFDVLASLQIKDKTIALVRIDANGRIKEIYDTFGGEKSKIPDALNLILTEMGFNPKSGMIRTAEEADKVLQLVADKLIKIGEVQKGLTPEEQAQIIRDIIGTGEELVEIAPPSTGQPTQITPLDIKEAAKYVKPGEEIVIIRPDGSRISGIVRESYPDTGQIRILNSENNNIIEDHNRGSVVSEAVFNRYVADKQKEVPTPEKVIEEISKVPPLPEGEVQKNIGDQVVEVQSGKFTPPETEVKVEGEIEKPPIILPKEVQEAFAYSKAEPSSPISYYTYEAKKRSVVDIATSINSILSKIFVIYDSDVYNNYISPVTKVEAAEGIRAKIPLLKFLTSNETAIKALRNNEALRINIANFIRFMGALAVDPNLSRMMRSVSSINIQLAVPHTLERAGSATASSMTIVIPVSEIVNWIRSTFLHELRHIHTVYIRPYDEQVLFYEHKAEDFPHIVSNYGNLTKLNNIRNIITYYEHLVNTLRTSYPDEVDTILKDAKIEDVWKFVEFALPKLLGNIVKSERNFISPITGDVLKMIDKVEKGMFSRMVDELIKEITRYTTQHIFGDYSLLNPGKFIERIINKLSDAYIIHKIVSTREFKDDLSKLALSLLSISNELTRRLTAGFIVDKYFNSESERQKVDSMINDAVKKIYDIGKVKIIKYDGDKKSLSVKDILTEDEVKDAIMVSLVLAVTDYISGSGAFVPGTFNIKIPNTRQFETLIFDDRIGRDVKVVLDELRNALRNEEALKNYGYIKEGEKLYVELHPFHIATYIINMLSRYILGKYEFGDTSHRLLGSLDENIHYKNVRYQEIFSGKIYKAVPPGFNQFYMEFIPLVSRPKNAKPIVDIQATIDRNVWAKFVPRARNDNYQVLFVQSADELSYKFKEMSIKFGLNDIIDILNNRIFPSIKSMLGPYQQKIVRGEDFTYFAKRKETGVLSAEEIKSARKILAESLGEYYVDDSENIREYVNNKIQNTGSNQVTVMTVRRGELVIEAWDSEGLLYRNSLGPANLANVKSFLNRVKTYIKLNDDLEISFKMKEIKHSINTEEDRAKIISVLAGNSSEAADILSRLPNSILHIMATNGYDGTLFTKPRDLSVVRQAFQKVKTAIDNKTKLSVEEWNNIVYSIIKEYPELDAFGYKVDSDGYFDEKAMKGWEHQLVIHLMYDLGRVSNQFSSYETIMNILPTDSKELKLPTHNTVSANARFKLQGTPERSANPIARIAYDWFFTRNFKEILYNVVDDIEAVLTKKKFINVESESIFEGAYEMVGEPTSVSEMFGISIKQAGLSIDIKKIKSDELRRALEFAIEGIINSPNIDTEKKIYALYHKVLSEDQNVKLEPLRRAINALRDYLGEEDVLKIFTTHLGELSQQAKNKLAILIENIRTMEGTSTRWKDRRTIPKDMLIPSEQLKELTDAMQVLNVFFDFATTKYPYDINRYIYNIYRDNQKWRELFKYVTLGAIFSSPHLPETFNIAPAFISAWIDSIPNAEFIKLNVGEGETSYIRFAVDNENRLINTEIFINRPREVNYETLKKYIADFIEETTHLVTRVYFSPAVRGALYDIYNKIIATVNPDELGVYALKNADEFMTAIAVKHLLGDEFAKNLLTNFESIIDRYFDYAAHLEQADLSMGGYMNFLRDYLRGGFENMLDMMRSYLMRDINWFELGKLEERLKTSEGMLELYETANQYVSNALQRIMLKDKIDNVALKDKEPNYDMLSYQSLLWLAADKMLPLSEKALINKVALEKKVAYEVERLKNMGLSENDINAILKNIGTMWDIKVDYEKVKEGFDFYKFEAKRIDEFNESIITKREKSVARYSGSLIHLIARNFAKHNINILSIGKKYGIPDVANAFLDINELQTYYWALTKKGFNAHQLAINHELKQLKEAKFINDDDIDNYRNYILYMSMLRIPVSFDDEDLYSASKIHIKKLSGIEFAGPLGEKITLQPLKPVLIDLLRKQVELQRAKTRTMVEAYVNMMGRLSDEANVNPELWTIVAMRSRDYIEHINRKYNLNMSEEEINFIMACHNAILNPYVVAVIETTGYETKGRLRDVIADLKEYRKSLEVGSKAENEVGKQIRILEDLRKEIRRNPAKYYKYIEADPTIGREEISTLQDYYDIINKYELDKKIAFEILYNQYNRYPQYMSRLRKPRKYYAVITKKEVPPEMPVSEYVIDTIFYGTYDSIKEAELALNTYIKNKNINRNEKLENGEDVYTISFGKSMSVAENLGLTNADTLRRYRIFDYNLLENIITHATRDRVGSDVLNQIKQFVTERTINRRMLHLEFVDGFDKSDIDYSFDKFTEDVSALYARALVKPERDKIIAKWKSSIPETDNWSHYYLNRFDEHSASINMLAETNIIKGIRLGTAFYALSRIATNIINLTQPISRGLSWISMITEGKNVGKYFVDGYNLVGKFTLVRRGLRDISTLTPKEKEIYNNVYLKAYEAGVLDLLVSRELAAKEIGAPITETGTVRKFMFLGQMITEGINLRWGYSAGASIGYDLGYRGEKLYAFASKFNKLVNDGVGPVNIPFIVTAIGRGRSPVTQSALRTLMLFTSFPIGYTQGLIEAIKLVPKGQIKPAVLATLPMIMMAGIWGLPIVGDLKHILSDTFNIDLDEFIREFAQSFANMPDWALDMILGGIPYTLGVDLRRSAGVDLMSRYVKVAVDVVRGHSDITNPFPGIEIPVTAIKSTYDIANEYIKYGDTYKFYQYLEKATPGLFTGVVRRINYKKYGVRDKNGNILIPAEAIDKVDEFIILTGAVPSSISRIRDIEKAKDRYESDVNRYKNYFVGIMEQAIRENNNEQYQQAIREIIEYNNTRTNAFEVLDILEIRDLALQRALDLQSTSEIKSMFTPEVEKLARTYGLSRSKYGTKYQATGIPYKSR